MSENVKELSGENFDQEVLRSSLPVVVDFWASWCPPCRAMAPIFDKLAGEFSGRISFTKVNVDDYRSLARSYEVMGIPSILMFKNQKYYGRIVGACPEAALRADLMEFLDA